MKVTIIVIWLPFYLYVVTDQKANKWQIIDFHVLLLTFWIMKFATGYGWKEIS